MNFNKCKYIIFIILIFTFSCAKYGPLQRADRSLLWFDIVKQKNSEYMVYLKGTDGITYNITYSKNPYKLIINMPQADVDPNVLKYSFSDDNIEGVAIYPSANDVTIEVLLKQPADYNYQYEKKDEVENKNNIEIKLNFAESLSILKGVGGAYSSASPSSFEISKGFYDANLTITAEVFVLDLLTKGVVRYNYGYLDETHFYVDLYDVKNYSQLKSYPLEGFVKELKIGSYENPQKVRILLTVGAQVPIYLGQNGNSLRVSNDMTSVSKEEIYLLNVSNIFVKKFQSLLFTLSREIEFEKKVLNGNLLLEFNKKIVPIKNVKPIQQFGENSPFRGYKVLYENGGSTIVIEPSQEVFALAARTPDGFVVSGSFEHFAKAESKITQGVPKDTIEKPTANDFITLNIKDMDVREAIRLIYFGRGKNLIFSNDVKGTSTLFVENVPYQTALEVILNENNLIKREEGNLIRIMTEEKYDKMTEETRRVKEEEVRQIVEQPLITEIVPVNYTKAADFQPIAELMLSDRGRLVLNERGNSFIVTDIPHAVEQMKKLLKDIDFATPQVTIEARIVEVTDTDSLNLGIQWGGKYVGTNLSNKDFPSSIVVTGDSFTGAQGISGNGYVVNFPFTPTQDLGVGNIALSMGSISGRYNLDVALQALQNQSKLKIISAPRVTTLDNIEAEINSGGKAIIVPTGDNTQTEEVETGIRLTVTPHITSNNMVFMDIEIEKSNIVPGSLTSNTVETEEKKATTQVLLADGETTVIGGILEDELNEGVSGVPYLSKIPILGFFFRNKASSRTKRELMLFLTPRIVNPRNEQLQTDVNAGGIR